MSPEENVRLEKLRLLILGDKTDESSDDLIKTLVEIGESRFLLIIRRIQRRLGLEQTENIPTELQWIVDEVVIKRFNRIGSEGYNSQSVEGHSISFTQDEFLEYEGDTLGFFEEFAQLDKRAGRMVVY